MPFRSRNSPRPVGFALAATGARRAADEANEAKTQFLSHVSHELKTPITVVRGFADLLHMSDLTQSQHDYVSKILEGSGHLTRLADDLLDMSQISTGQVQLRLERIDPLVIVQEVLALAEPIAAKQGVQLEPPVVEGDGEVDLLADSMRLRQVLFNLVTNAIKYNRPDGVVRTSISKVPNAVRIAVDDTGLGHRQRSRCDSRRSWRSRRPLGPTNAGSSTPVDSMRTMAQSSPDAPLAT